jgi:hypothetical protein
MLCGWLHEVQNEIFAFVGWLVGFYVIRYKMSFA